MQNKLVLVTGGNGFIGRATVDELLNHGYQVRILDREPQAANNSRTEYIQGEIENLETVKLAMKNVSWVIHAAAMSRSGPSNQMWNESIQSNIVGTSNVLVSARESKVKKFVYCGSSTYYGNQSGPQKEDFKPDLLNVYGVTKYAGEQFTKIFDEVFDLPTITLRYFNVYGLGQPDDPINGLVLGIFLRAKSEGKKVTLDGGGEQTRDFVEVRDVARANRLALETSNRNKIINIGSGEKVSIKDLATILELNFSIGTPRIGDALTTEADILNAKNFLNWEPQISLQKGIKDLLAHQDLGPKKEL